MKKYFQIIIILLVSKNAFAAIVEKDDVVLFQKKEVVSADLEKHFFTMGPKEFNFTLPSKWRAAYDLFGTPLMLLGPREKDSRPVLMVIPLKGKNLNFEKKSLASFKKFYREGRRKWIKKQPKGEALEFYPESFINIEGISSGIGAGYKYRLGQRTYTEYTYYFSCNRDFFHFKSLFDETSRSHKKDLENIIGSFKCKN